MQARCLRYPIRRQHPLASRLHNLRRIALEPYNCYAENKLWTVEISLTVSWFDTVIIQSGGSAVSSRLRVGLPLR